MKTAFNVLSFKKQYFYLILCLSILFSSQSQSAAPWSCRFILNKSASLPFDQKMIQAQSFLDYLPPTWSDFDPSIAVPKWGNPEKVVSILKNRQAFVEWIVELRADFYENLKRIDASNPSRYEIALEMAMEVRARKLGFVLDNAGMMFRHVGTSEKDFFERFKKRELFLDLSFANAVAFTREFGLLIHGKHSHALQMLYMAENYAGFVENVYKRIGETEDGAFWAHYFDRANSQAITNNAVFNFVVMAYLLRLQF